MNTRDCLRAFLKERPDDLEHIMVLVSVTATSISRWKNDMLPKALNLLALRFFLKMAGYTVDEFASLRPGACALAEALVFGKVDIDRVIKEADMPPGKPDNVYKILCRGGKFGTKREQIFLLLAHSVRIQVSEKRAELEKVLWSSKKMVNQHQDASPKVATAIKAVVGTQEALLVFLGNGATRTDREELRAALKKVGVSIHDLCETVTSLLSEKSLEQQKTLNERYK